MTEYSTAAVRFIFAMGVSSEKWNGQKGTAKEDFDRWLEEYTRQECEKAWDEGFAAGEALYWT